MNTKIRAVSTNDPIKNLATKAVLYEKSISLDIIHDLKKEHDENSGFNKQRSQSCIQFSTNQKKEVMDQVVKQSQGGKHKTSIQIDINKLPEDNSKRNIIHKNNLMEIKEQINKNVQGINKKAEKETASRYEPSTNLEKKRFKFLNFITFGCMKDYWLNWQMEMDFSTMSDNDKKEILKRTENSKLIDLIAKNINFSDYFSEIVDNPKTSGGTLTHMNKCALSTYYMRVAKRVEDKIQERKEIADLEENQRNVEKWYKSAETTKLSGVLDYMAKNTINAEILMKTVQNKSIDENTLLHISQGNSNYWYPVRKAALNKLQERKEKEIADLEENQGNVGKWEKVAEETVFSNVLDYMAKNTINAEILMKTVQNKSIYENTLLHISQGNSNYWYPVRKAALNKLQERKEKEIADLEENQRNVEKWAKVAEKTVFAGVLDYIVRNTKKIIILKKALENTALANETLLHIHPKNEYGQYPFLDEVKKELEKRNLKVTF